MNVIYLREKNNMEKEYLYNSSYIPNNIQINNEIIGSKEKIIIAGPCTFASYEEAYSIAKELKKLGIKFFSCRCL